VRTMKAHLQLRLHMRRAPGAAARRLGRRVAARAGRRGGRSRRRRPGPSKAHTSRAGGEAGARRAQLRLLMCYAATHPEKLDGAKLAQWQKLARLSDADIATLTNLECLGVPVLKRAKPGRLAGLVRKRNRAVRKVPPGGLLTLSDVGAAGRRAPSKSRHGRVGALLRPCPCCRSTQQSGTTNS